MFGSSWKTSICGAILLAGGIVLIIVGQPLMASGAIIAGVGLLSAKDSDVTGGTKPYEQ